MAQPLEPHVFTPQPGTTACSECSLPSTNQIHTVKLHRARFLLITDLSAEVSHADLQAIIIEALRPLRDVTLVDIKSLP